ncbi:glycosyltransferase family 9 protein [Sphaerimonospora thailandensis]|uniref:Glycosyl transferase n=1 Tax=Sphaerimonospora thailandensis TaxID=795644 RepID=A0A8J3RD84_9ACTN|nr:glycosyltransferase family 9 protein [Sphaerimonospora thailandensis]GIH72878.1 glycosyl transferase [Sphaerimonospora thailandensis]
MALRPVLLALRGLGLGDLLTAVPALRALRRAHPEHRIVLAAPAHLGGLLPLIGAVDELVDMSGPGPVPGGAVPGGTVPYGLPGIANVPDIPDIAVNLHGSGPQSIVALRRARRLLSHAHPAVPGVAGPPWRPEIHEVRRWCEMLEWYGITVDHGDLALRDPGPSRWADAEAVIHPGAGYRAKQWPPERFAGVAAELSRLGLHVVITGGPEEIALARQVAELAGLPGPPAARVLAGRTDLRELAALVGGAKLVICGDTGMSHLATAVGTPSVVIYGPVSPALWGPPPGHPHVTLWTGRTGDPYGDRPSEGLLEIGVRDVLDAAYKLLRSRAGEHQPGRRPPDRAREAISTISASLPPCAPRQ